MATRAATKKRDPAMDAAVETLQTAVDTATESGAPSTVELSVPARPPMEAVIDQGALHKAFLLIERDTAHAQVRVIPRRASGAPDMSEYFEEDHIRLDEIAAKLRAYAEKNDVRAVPLTHLFAEGLRRHVRMEEGVVFPVYEARMAGAAAALPRMRAEHAVVIDYLDKIVARVATLVGTARGTDWTHDVLGALTGLEAILHEHNQREEKMLFPLLDKTTAPFEKEHLLKRLVLF